MLSKFSSEFSLTVKDPAEAMAEIVQFAAEHDLTRANEAATRLLIIDRVLADVLGWSRAQFNPEAATHGTAGPEWIDYHLDAGGVAKVVVEAKRKGKTFALPAGRRRSRFAKMSTVRTSWGKNLRDALAQAREYCDSTGTINLIVTNGFQWVATVAFVPHVRRDDLRCVVFDGLDDIRANLSEFIGLFSVEAIGRQALRVAALSGEQSQPAFAESINLAFQYNPPRSSNYLANALEALARTALNVLPADDPDMVSRCYVPNELTEGYVARLELFVGKTVPECLAGSRKLDRMRVKDDAESWATDLADAGEPLLLVGKVGSGKTSFLTLAASRLWATTEHSDTVFLNLDLVSQTHLAARTFNHDALKSELCSRLLTQLEDRYPALSPYQYETLTGIFSKEIQRQLSSLPPALQKKKGQKDSVAAAILPGLKADLVGLLIRTLEFLRKNRRLAVLVVFDNVDQGTEEFERFVVQLARSISEQTGVTTLCAIRDTTYERGLKGGFLDVSQNTVFRISPPPFDSVFSKRLEYIRLKIGEDNRLRRRVLRACENYPIERVVDFADVLGDLVLGKNRDVSQCVQSLAGTNVRLALELVREFSTSQNIDIDALLKQYNRDYYRQPVELFLRAVMLGSKARYVEQESRILNLFHVRHQYRDSHYTGIRILQFLHERAINARGDTDVPIMEVFTEVGMLGHSIARVREWLESLGRHGAVHSRSHPELPWPDHASVRIGGAGRYYLDVLITNREYFADIVDDTIIYDPAEYDAIANIHRDDSRSWPDRYSEKSRVFARYLRKEEAQELSSGHSPPWLRAIGNKLRR